LILDITHNAVLPFTYDGCNCWLHRKGAAPADCGPVIIPGSRDDLSFIVQPIAPTEALASLAHGAGRKIARKEAQGKLERLYSNKDKLKRNQWGGEVICGDAPLLWQEAKECYKDVATVIHDLEAAGLIKCIASLRPLVTFKTSEIAREEQRRDRESWQRERSKARANKARR
jgi:release factor H-coupled RctB family protein